MHLQTELFELNVASRLRKNGEDFVDPAFANNKSLPIHRWVPWIAGFSSLFVQDVLQRYMTKKGTVLDPFAGVGTTLIEACTLGHDAIGFEINPYAALASKVKVASLSIDLKLLRKNIDLFEEFCINTLKSNYTPFSKPPETFKTRIAFYNPKILRKVLVIQDFISSLKNKRINDLFMLAFGATMVRYSNYSYEPSLGTRKGSGKNEFDDFPVIETMKSKLSEMSEDVEEIQFKPNPLHGKGTVINDSFFNVTKHLMKESIDIVITSPPYLNNYHYNRNTRPQLYWLGYALSTDDMQKLEEMNFGKYWQTVREKDNVRWEFSSPSDKLIKTIQNLSGCNQEKGIYGGKGWANYAISYFNDCHKLATGIKHALKSDHYAFIVIGNSILQGIQIPTDEFFGEIAEYCGLKLIEINVPRKTRIGNSIIQSTVRVTKAKNSHSLYEAVVVVKKK
ncbi:MAG: DNA methyltransferase [Bacteroidota bacterium]